MLHRFFIVTLLASTWLLACGSDDTSGGVPGGSGGTTTSTGTGGSTSSGGGGGGGTGGAAPTCDNNGFVVAQERVLGGSGATLYRARTSDTPPYDSLSIQLWHDQGAPTGAFVFAFDGDNYETCNTCGLIGTDCVDDLYENCQQLFLVIEGQLEITNNASTLVGSLTNARAVEVTIDWNTFISTEVANGEDWCITSHTFDTNITQN